MPTPRITGLTPAIVGVLLAGLIAGGAASPILEAAEATEGSDVTQDTIRFKVTDKVLARVDDRLFGQFMERPSWGETGVEGAVISDAGELQPRVLELLEEMKMPIVRFPGGTDVDYIDWRDMVDNVPGRPGGRPVTTGHTGQQVTNRFGYDEFLRLSERLGWQDIIVVNLGDALLGHKPVRDAALHAAGLVAYCNAPVGAALPDGMPDWPAVRAANGHPEPYGVKYIQLGNETWALRQEAGREDRERWTETFVESTIEYERAIHAVDPDAVLLMDYDEGATPVLRERLGDRIPYVCCHFYTPLGHQQREEGRRRGADAGPDRRGDMERLGRGALARP